MVRVSMQQPSAHHQRAHMKTEDSRPRIPERKIRKPGPSECYYLAASTLFLGREEGWRGDEKGNNFLCA